MTITRGLIVFEGVYGNNWPGIAAAVLMLMIPILVLFMFLMDWRSPIVVGLAIPVSIMTTFAFLYFANVGLNLMSLGGLAIAIGLLVDAAVVMASLETFSDVAGSFGELFPAGSENGKDSKAAPAIWEDRAGFDDALAKWQDAVAAAIDAAPATVEDTKAALGPVFNACKGCHDSYRLEDD